MQLDRLWHPAAGSQSANLSCALYLTEVLITELIHVEHLDSHNWQCRMNWQTELDTLRRVLAKLIPSTPYVSCGCGAAGADIDASRAR